MAYLRDIQQVCWICHKVATVELVSVRNEIIGRFCTPCGKKHLAKFQAAEDQIATARTTRRAR